MLNEPKTVLVVDDETAVRDLVQALLRSLGHTARTASGGPEALDLIQSHSFDLVLTDLAMPGMNGEQLAHEIKKQLPAVPVVLITGLTPANVCPEIARVLGKPFSRDQLRQTIADLTSCNTA